MPKTKHTTVVLSDSVQKFKDALAPIYGLKNILSAGLFLLSRLNDTEQKRVIREINQLSSEPQSQPDEPIIHTKITPATLREAVRGLVSRAKEPGPGQIIRLSSPDEKMLSELQRLLGPEQKGDAHRKGKQA